jgi:drug/metabolite transporter (DMT)-like permease
MIQKSVDSSRPAKDAFPVVAGLLIVDSLHFVFARLLLPHISPGASAMYVLAIGTVEIGLLGLIRGRLRLRALRDHLGFFLALGLLVGVSTNINYQAVAFIDPGTASLLAKTSILFGLGFGLLWLHEKLTPIQIGGALVALLGVFVVSFQAGNYLRLGSLLILASAFMYALHAAIVKRYGGKLEFLEFFFFRLLSTTGKLEFLEFFFFRLLSTTGFLFLLALGRRTLVWPTATAWPLLALVGTVDVVVSRTLYYVALRQLKMSVHAIVLTLSPAVTVLWSLLLFDVVPTPQQLVGGAAVIAGVLVVTVKRRD